MLLILLGVAIIRYWIAVYCLILVGIDVMCVSHFSVSPFLPTRCLFGSVGRSGSVAHFHSTEQGAVVDQSQV